MGYSVAGAGDVNGDGFSDVVVGARLYDAGQTNEGAALVFLGSPFPVCSDSHDNDGDGFVDYPADRNCAGPNGATELSPPGCGLGGEVMLLLVPLLRRSVPVRVARHRLGAPPTRFAVPRPV